MALHHHVRGDITIDTTHAAHHGKGADVHELVNTQHPTDHSTIIDIDMPRYGNSISNHNAITQAAVMSDMAIGHKQIAVTKNRLLISSSCTVNGDVLANAIAIADYHFCGIPGVFEVLRFLADAGTGKDVIISP